MFSLASFFCAVAALKLPETLNRPVPDTVEELVASQNMYKKLLNEDDDDVASSEVRAKQ